MTNNWLFALIGTNEMGALVGRMVQDRGIMVHVVGKMVLLLIHHALGEDALFLMSKYPFHPLSISHNPEWTILQQ